METGQLVFWGVIALISICAMWTSYLGRLEIEKTIRKAIESGAVLDPVTVARLKSSAGGQTPSYIVVAGIIIVAASFGMVALAFAILSDDPSAFVPMLGISALLGAIGIGVIVGGAWMLRQRYERPNE